MAAAKFLVAKIEDPLPAVARPFAVLVDSDDEGWDVQSNAARLIRKLLDAECRYFVCYGRRAEALHDAVDDVAIEGGYPLVTTTFHPDETKPDVMEFFRMVVIPEMNGALILVQDVEGWTQIAKQSS